MRMTLPYGDGWVDAELPDRTRLVPSSWMPAKLGPVPDLAAAIRAALNQPLEMPPLTELARKGSRVLIAFDDPTVVCFAPLRAMAIKAVLEDLRRAGVEKRDIWLVCASALHRRWTRQEIGRVIGDDLVQEFGYRVFSHDAEDRDQLSYIGATPNGYDVEVNRLVTECDLTIYVNGSALRGLTGGWKSVCVGLSTYRSIRWHHSPEGLSAAVHNNPLHRVLDEMGALLESRIGKNRIFKIETVLANPFEAAHVFAGDVGATRRKVLSLLQEAAPPKPKDAEKADVILYGLPAYSPYATFARMNPILTLFSTGLGYLGGSSESMGKPGCTVIMATPCPNEWDEVHHAAYREVWERVLAVTRDPWEMRDLFEEDFANRPDYLYKYRFCYSFHPTHGLMASYPLRRLKHIGQVIVAGPKDPALIRHAGFVPTATVEEAIATAEARHGRDCSIALIQHLPT
ncbi:MAG: DUF2088 domain-containing protein [Nitrospirae bacterium]|nr:DUF2088 domain-containing protein [Nitrospirota bacterium]